MISKAPRLIDGTRRLEKEEILKILEEGEYGIVSTVGQDGHPYGFPMSYILMDNFIYFHCALEGHKMDNMRYNNRVSFCVVGDTKLIPQDLDTAYESVILFGESEEVHGEEKLKALIEIVNKYCEGFELEGKLEAERDQEITAVVKISIDSIAGKSRRM